MHKGMDMMELLFRQRFFSWLDSYDVYNEKGEVAFSINGQLSFGHRLAVCDASGNQVGLLQQKLFTLLPKFEIYKNNELCGEIIKEFTFFVKKYKLSYSDWSIEGDIMGWNYQIITKERCVATISKKLLNFTDTYSLKIFREEDALDVLLIVLAIDAANCEK